MAEVKMLVFNNGLQIVGEFQEVDKTLGKITIKKPVQLIVVPPQGGSQEGKVGMAFTPFMQYTDEWESGIVLSAVDVLCVLTPTRDLLNNYISNFGSGIVIPGGLISR